MSLGNDPFSTVAIMNRLENRFVPRALFFTRTKLLCAEKGELVHFWRLRSAKSPVLRRWIAKRSVH